MRKFSNQPSNGLKMYSEPLISVIQIIEDTWEQDYYAFKTDNNRLCLLADGSVV